MNQYAWLIWIGAVVVFSIAEAVTVNLVSVWFVVGALAALITRSLGGSVVLQVVVFLVTSVVMLALLRPFVRRYVSPHKTPTNADMALGKQTYLTETVDNLRETGALKLDGKEWSVRSTTGAVLPAGTLVKVVKLQGVKLYVEPVYQNTPKS